MRRAVKIALTPPTGPVFLSLPGDVLGLAFAAALEAPIAERPAFGVFRM